MSSQSLFPSNIKEQEIFSSKLGDITGQICQFAKDKTGSKFLICKLYEAPTDRKNAVFNEMIPNLKILMMDKFANLVVQKYFSVGNANHRQKLFSEILSNFFELSCSEYGSFVVRKAIKQSTNIQMISFMKQCAEQNVVSLATDIYGNYIIQELIITASHQCQVSF